MCQGYWERLQEEERLNARKLKIASVSLKREGEDRSLNVSFDPMTCTSAQDIFQQILPRFRNSPGYEPWANILQISFNGKQFKKIVA